MTTIDPASKHICCRCGDLKLGYQMTWHEISTTPAGVDAKVLMCTECDGASDCTFGNGLTGVHHTEVWDIDDLLADFNTIVNDRPSELRSLSSHRVGICSRCKTWMIWSTKRQRWVDPDYDMPFDPILENSVKFLDIAGP